MVVIARQAANAHPAVGQLVDVVGTFALGTGVMVAVLAGLAAIATAWNRITRDAKEAQRAQEEAGERAKSILGDLQLEDFGPGGQAAADLVAINEQIETMRRTIDAVRQTGQQDPFTLGVVGLAPGGAAKDIEKLQDQLSDLVGQRLALLETVRRAEERAGDERQREIEDEQRQIERLIEARTRMVQILGAASISSPFGEFNVSDIGGKLEESFRETEELRGHIRGLTDAMDDLISMGEEVPAGSIQLLSRLQQALADADADVQRRVTRLKERWEEFQTVTIRSEVTPPQIIIPAIVDPFSLTALEDTFENATAAIQERFVRGVIDQDAFEQQGREAAQRFNDAILAKIDQLRADGRLAEALELALQLKLDVEVPDSAAFNDTIEAVRNVTSGIRDLADALGDMSPQLSAALRSVDSFINGINQIQAGRETGGTIGALSQVSGVLGIAAGVFQIFQGLDAAKRAEEEQARRMAEQTRESVRALADFAKGLEDATQFDRHYEDLADATRKALLDAFRETQAGRGVSEEQIGIDVQNLEDFIDAEGIQALLESWKKFGGIWAEIAGEYEAAAAKIEEVRQREISRMLEDIEVRALVAQGRDSEAAVLRQAIQHEKELAEARALGFTAEQIARLEEVQAMEKVAEAAKEVSNALRGVPQGFRILNLELIRFNAMQAETADTSPTDPGTPVQPPTPTGPTQPGGPTDTGPGGRQTPGGPVFNIDDNRTYRFEIAQQPGESPAQFADRVRVIVREMDRQDDLLFDGFTRAAQR